MFAGRGSDWLVNRHNARMKTKKKTKKKEKRKDFAFHVTVQQLGWTTLLAGRTRESYLFCLHTAIDPFQKQ